MVYLYFFLRWCFNHFNEWVGFLTVISAISRIYECALYQYWFGRLPRLRPILMIIQQPINEKQLNWLFKNDSTVHWEKATGWILNFHRDWSYTGNERKQTIASVVAAFWIKVVVTPPFPRWMGVTPPSASKQTNSKRQTAISTTSYPYCNKSVALSIIQSSTNNQYNLQQH